jgi:hypothetical protein
VGASLEDAAEAFDVLIDFSVPAATLAKGGSQHSPKETSWFQGVKDFFEGLKP